MAAPEADTLDLVVSRLDRLEAKLDVVFELLCSQNDLLSQAIQTQTVADVATYVHTNSEVQH